jgi:hypothetical protein
MWFGWNWAIGTVLVEIMKSTLWFILSLPG